MGSNNLIEFQVPKDTFARLTEDGSVEVVNVITGAVVSSAAPADFLDVSTYQLKPEMADIICQEIMSGKLIKDICQDLKIPFYVFVHWTRSNATFGHAIKFAKKERAHVFHDKVIEEAEAVTDKESALIARTKMEAYKWAAEKGNPDEYGNKTKISGDDERPLTLVVKTGVPDPDEPDALPEPKNVS